MFHQIHLKWAVCFLLVTAGVVMVACESEGDNGDNCLVVPDATVNGDADIRLDADVDEDAFVFEDAYVELDDCPSDMVEVGPFCMDVYEASRPDATEDDQGSETGPALSVPGVIPWHVSTMNLERLAEFEEACEAAGKRICRPYELRAACGGPGGSAYVFGDVFDPLICNCVDTFCEQHCADNEIPPEDCVTGPNCGYTYYCFRVMPTGSFPGCTNELGTFDLSGNVWEVAPSTSDPRGYDVLAGAFNCAGAEARLQCNYNAGWDELFAGFRCCLDR